MSHETPVQPKLDELLTGYLQRKAGDHAAGLVTFDPAAEAEVVLHEAGPVQPIDAKLAWVESLVVAGFYVPFVDSRLWRAPPNWPSLVSGHEPVVALACALGNFPQLVRHFHTLLQAPNLGQLRPLAGRAASVSMLLDWVREVARQVQFPQLLLGLGALRLAKHFEEADKIIQAQDADVKPEWRTAWENEKAALAWHRGQHQAARELWHKLEPIAPVLFNRGMADLFLDEPAAAQGALTQAVAILPDDGAWHHLGRLYLTLAQTRSPSGERLNV